jgi:hypothetical protein
MIKIKSLGSRLSSSLRTEDYKYLCFCEEINSIVMFDKSKQSLLILQKGNEIREIPIKNWEPIKLDNSKNFILCVGNHKKTANRYRIYCLIQNIWVKEFSFKQKIEDLFW